MFLCDGNLDSLSAKTISLPGKYCIVQSYFWDLNNMDCSLGGAACMAFFWTISRGL